MSTFFPTLQTILVRLLLWLALGAAIGALAVAARIGVATPPAIRSRWPRSLILGCVSGLLGGLLSATLLDATYSVAGALALAALATLCAPLAARLPFTSQKYQNRTAK